MSFWRNDEGQQVDIAVLGAGESFMHAALIGAPLAVSYIAMDPLLVAVTGITEFESRLMRRPPVALRFSKDAVRVVHQLLSRVKVLSMEDVYGRVVWLLLRRAALDEGRLVTDRLTHADIGRRVGATREMVGRVLRDLVRDGYVAATGGRFTILGTPPPRRRSAALHGAGERTGRR
jgi:CRP/FNR family cyclic AMP-dependent transcriptional regulator